MKSQSSDSHPSRLVTLNSVVAVTAISLAISVVAASSVKATESTTAPRTDRAAVELTYVVNQQIASEQSFAGAADNDRLPAENAEAAERPRLRPDSLLLGLDDRLRWGRYPTLTLRARSKEGK